MGDFSIAGYEWFARSQIDANYYTWRIFVYRVGEGFPSSSFARQVFSLSLLPPIRNWDATRIPPNGIKNTCNRNLWDICFFSVHTCQIVPAHPIHIGDPSSYPKRTMGCPNVVFQRDGGLYLTLTPTRFTLNRSWRPYAAGRGPVRPRHDISRLPCASSPAVHRSAPLSLLTPCK